MANFVFSPSNMDTYRQCARKFQAQTLTKELPWKATTQKSRGSLVHSGLGKAIREGLQAVATWPDGVDPFYVHDRVTELREAMAAGAVAKLEHELTIDNTMRAAAGGWWDDNAFLRARADLLVLPTDINFIDVVDFKTGKIYDSDAFQLRVECLLAHLIYHRPIVRYAYWYVDQGQTVDGLIDFRNGLSPVQDIINLMQQMRLAIRDTNFPPTKNMFCRWCGLDKTPKCGL